MGTRRNILRAMNENQLQSQPVCDSRAWNWTWITKMRGDLLSILFHPGQLHLRQPYPLPTCDLPTHRLIRDVHRYCSWSLGFPLHGLGLTRAFLLFQDPCLLGAVGSDQLSSRRRWTSGAYGATFYISLPCVSRYSCGFTAFATCESTGSNKKSSIGSR